jgi:hypothetical protein
MLDRPRELEQLKLPAASLKPVPRKAAPHARTRRSEVGYDQTLGLIVERFREDSEQVTREPLPTRWVELILHLDERERNRRARPQSSGGPGVLEAEIVVNKQEEVLRELLRTEEPTEEARALLEDLRRTVARAVAERD